MAVVSVVLPAFEAAATIDEAIWSIRRQRLARHDLELVVVDDGSTDATAELIAAHAADDERVRLLRRPHCGVVGAAAAAVEASTGAYVARMDADDLAHPDRLACQVDLLESDVTLSVAGCLVRVPDPDPDRPGFARYIEWVNSVVTPDQIARDFYVELPVPHPTTMVRRRELIEMGGIVDRGGPEDYDLWLRFHRAGRRFAKVPEVLHEWRDLPGRLTRTDPRYAVERFIEVKATHLCAGPLAERSPVLVWGAGKYGRRLSKHLIRGGAELTTFFDIDAAKIGRTLRARPILDAEELPAAWSPGAIVLAAVSSHGARDLIRERLDGWGFVETRDYLCVA